MRIRTGPTAPIARITLLALLVLLALAGALAAQPVATSDDVEAYARMLVDHPALGSGEVDVAAHAWLDRIEQEPSHPLTQAALVRVGMVRGALMDPAVVDARVLSLVPDARWAPMARRELELLAGRVRAQREQADALEGADLFPSFLRRFAVLAPLGPDRPLGWIDGAPAFAERMQRPRLADEHDGLHGPVRWQPLERPGGWPGVTPGRGHARLHGWALLAATFESPRAGPGFVEVEVLDARGDASYAISINGATPLSVDHLGEERARGSFHPAALRRGTNRVVLLTPLATEASFALRVIGRDGSPWPDLVQLDPLADRDVAPPGLVDPPTVRPLTAAGVLRQQRPGPDGLALRGLLMIEAGRPAQGLADLEDALEAAPERWGLASLLVRVLDGARHLPEGTRRQRARTLAEAVLAARPDDVPTGLWMAGLEVAEDEPLRALERLEALSRTQPRQVLSRLDRHALLAGLGLEFEAERALAEALRVAPESPVVLWRAVEASEQRERRRDALEFARRAVAAGGRTPGALARLAEHELQLGHPDLAEEALRDAVRRDPARDPTPLVQRLVDTGRDAEAAALVRPLLQLVPDWDEPHRLLARLAARAGDDAAEAEHWRAVLAIAPSDPVARARLAQLGDPDPAVAIVERFALDRDEVLAGFDPGAWPGESLVRVLDHAVAVVFEDGVTETVTHDIWHARDLDAVEQLGTRRVPGEALEVATIKGPASSEPGAIVRPVRVDGVYQLPQLEPGDFVETRFRTREAPGADGVARPGRWTFANEDMPFDASHYVVAIPDGQPIEIATHDFTGRTWTERVGERTVHVWRAERLARVPPEAKAPPREWYMPWVELGADEDIQAVAAALRQQMLAATIVTPELRDAASTLARGIGDETQRARRAYDFVNEHLDARDGSTFATHALLERKGNATTLFAALLRALRIEHEVVWSRDVSPEADGEPDPPFAYGQWYARKPYVVVRPAGGDVVWCDLASRELPFGTTTGGAPRAPVLVPSSGRVVREPDAGGGEPSTRIDVALAIEPGGGARVSARVTFLGSLGYVLKEPIRQVPATQRPLYATLLAAEALPGLAISALALPGLEEPGQPVGIDLSGSVAQLLDDDGTCRLPLRPLALSERYAVEGRRRLPLLEPAPLVDRTHVRLDPDDGVQLDRVPESVVLEFREGLYALTFEPAQDGGLLVQRRVVMPPFSLDPEEFDEFLEFCRRVDDAEETRLRFVPAE